MITLSQLELGAERAGVYDYEVRKDYSGRGMRGAKCLGLVVDSPADAYAILAGAAAEAEYDDETDLADEWLALFRKSRLDSMGLQSIVYFPGVVVEP